ncbi:MAG: P-loop NTPase [Chromatiales bacterium]|jgi:MinD-like ATPase involved in chromosome partitioning or flagellar assembly
MSEGLTREVHNELSSTMTPSGDPARARVIAIASGQTGVGKTNIATNLAIALSTRGLRVCVLDADSRPANVHALLGYTPHLTLEHLMGSDSRSIDDVLANGPSGIKVLPNAGVIADYLTLDETRQHRLLMGLDSLERRFDYIFIDTAAGVRNSVLDFLRAAQHTLMVLTPDPKTLSGAFAVLQALARRGRVRPVHVLINMAADYEESSKVYRRFASTVEKYLHLRVDYLGFIRVDETVTSSVELKRPVILLKHRAPASRCFFELAADLVRQSGSWRSMPSFAQFWSRLTPRRSEAERTERPSTDEFARPPTGELPTTRTGEFRRPEPSTLIRPTISESDTAAPPAARPEAPAPQPPKDEPRLSRYTITRAARGLIEDEEVQPDDAETFLSGLIDAFAERFERYPFRLRDVLVRFLELEDYPRAEIRHLAMLLEDLYEKRYQRPIHGLESSVMRLFAHAADSEERVMQLAEQLRAHYLARFGKRLYEPASEVLSEARAEKLSRSELGQLVRDLAEIYEQRFGHSALGAAGLSEVDELRREVQSAITDQRRILGELERILARLDGLRGRDEAPQP